MQKNVPLWLSMLKSTTGLNEPLNSASPEFAADNQVCVNTFDCIYPQQLYE